VSDWRNFESWQEAGAPRAEQKANAVFKQLLNEYEQPHLDDAIQEELAEYIDQSKSVC